MLEKPDLDDSKIAACLQDGYGLAVRQIAFLPLGADLNTAVYRVVAADGTPYFCKLRSGTFDETSVLLPRFLNDLGIRQIIAPLTTPTGRLWAGLDPFKVILYPFVEGRDGYQVEMADRHWIELGAALRRIHTAPLPAALTSRIRREMYSPQWRETIKQFLEHIEDEFVDDPVAYKVVAFMRAKKAETRALVTRAERLAQILQERPPPFVLCHSDLHAGNVLITADDAFYIVDWDDPILAPKERDLMYPGGAQGFMGHTAAEEEALFYRGYGSSEVDPFALAYYRYERIIQDIAIYCEQLLLSTEGGQDRAQSYHYLTSNFRPNNTIEVAYAADTTSRDGGWPHPWKDR